MGRMAFCYVVAWLVCWLRVRFGGAECDSLERMMREGERKGRDDKGPLRGFIDPSCSRDIKA